MRRLIAGISLLMFILPQGAWADPSPGINWLINDPLTLFDFGLYKADKELQKIGKELQKSNRERVHIIMDSVNTIREIEIKLKNTEDINRKEALTKRISNEKFRISSFNDLFNFRQFLAYSFVFADYEVEKNENVITA